MLFKLLLFILSSKFKKSSKTDSNFKKFLMGHECAIVVKTKTIKVESGSFLKTASFPVIRYWINMMLPWFGRIPKLHLMP